MLHLTGLSLPLSFGEADLRAAAARVLGVSPADLTHLALTRQSVDARRKDNVHYVCSLRCAVPNEAAVLRRVPAHRVRPYREEPYLFPAPRRRGDRPRPVVAGMGPAGLFAALMLARNGLPPLLLERGRDVDHRTADVAAFWAGAPLSPLSNVQFGEGGAGTFSDGKLNTGTHDPRIRTVLAELVRHGAPEDILWQQHPHVGTDLLRGVVKSIRQELLDLGCQIRFETRLTGLALRQGALSALRITDGAGVHELPCDTLILAIGHSARDTFRMLWETGVPMEAKPFAVGVRIEHSQAALSEAQYGPAWTRLPPSAYKLACHLPDGRGVFSFCVCPGGQVVAASSGPEQVVTNGMSLRARDGENINGGLLVGVSPADFPGADPLAGIRFQEQWERAAWALAGGRGAAPAQNAASFLRGGAPSLASSLTPTYRPGVEAAELDRCLPPFVAGSLRAALPLLGRKLRGFDDPGALLTGVETRSSSPVRLLRGSDGQSPLRGLYPCGEGAGWAGGITSAAVDGIKTAEQIAVTE